MIIDEYLRGYDVAKRHQILINASRERVYDAVCAFDMNNSPIARVLLALRSFNFTFSKKKNQLGSTLDALQKNGFILLKNNPPEELLLGLVGKFWAPSGCIQKMDADTFSRFNDSGFAKAVWNFHIMQQPDGRMLLSTETRIRCADDTSRKRFRRYWFVVGPFSGLIRREALRIIKQDAERENTSSATPPIP